MELYPDSLKEISGDFHESVSSFEVDENEFLEFESSFPTKEKKYEPSQDLFLEMVDKLEDPKNIKSNNH